MHHKQVRWKRKSTKQQWIVPKERRLTAINKAEINFVLSKTLHDEKKCNYFLWVSESIISLHVLKLALNKSMCVYDNEQGINKLRPFLRILFQFKKLLERIDLMYTPPKCSYSYFLPALDFYLRVLFRYEYP